MNCRHDRIKMTNEGNFCEDCGVRVSLNFADDDESGMLKLGVTEEK